MTKDANIITGWRIRDGAAVYLGADRTWVTDPQKAIRLGSEKLDEELTWARSPTVELEIVDPYSMVLTDTGLGGRKIRETIRAVGPTVRPDLQRPSSVNLNDLRKDI
ncbi:MAG: DUF2849 domain-containing protein [Myxococcales bacterium]|nr:DUF2849 domain-containing protein [Myxococcales bacterium]